MSQEHYARIAELYDAFVQTEYDVPFFTQEAHRVGAEILELMAGTGRLTLPLAAAGIPVTAVDFSAEMLALLEAKLAARGLAATVVRADVRSFDLGRQFMQIIIPFQAFPELTTSEDQRRALQNIHRHLHPAGEFICTLHNPPVRIAAVDNQLRLVVRRPRDDGGTLLVWLLQQHEPGSATVEVLEFFEIYDSAGMLTSRRYSSLRFHLLARADFERQLEETGFAVVDLYGDYDYTPFAAARSPFMIWRLRRREPSSAG